MDKQKFLGLLATIMIAAVAAFNVSLNSQEDVLSDLAMENVEALASESFTIRCEAPPYILICFSIDGYTAYGKKLSEERF